MKNGESRSVDKISAPFPFHIHLINLSLLEIIHLKFNWVSIVPPISPGLFIFIKALG